MSEADSKSKKPSGVNSNSKRREVPTFFVDRSLGTSLVPTALRSAGANVIAHNEKFSPDERDEVWLAVAGDLGWLVLTKDKKIQFRTLEQIAVAKHNVKLFALVAGDLQGSEMAAIWTKALPQILNFAKGNKAPFIAKVSKSCSITLAMKHSQLRRLLK